MASLLLLHIVALVQFAGSAEQVCPQSSQCPGSSELSLAALLDDSSEAEAVSLLQVRAKHKAPKTQTMNIMKATDQILAPAPIEAKLLIATQAVRQDGKESATAESESQGAQHWSLALLSLARLGRQRLWRIPEAGSPATWTADMAAEKLPEVLAVAFLFFLPLLMAICCCGLCGHRWVWCCPSKSRDMSIEDGILPRPMDRRLFRASSDVIPHKVRDRVSMDAAGLIREGVLKAATAQAEIAAAAEEGREDNTPGTFVATKEVVSITEGISIASKVSGNLRKGTRVEIIQVIQNTLEQRLRGRLRSPPGWVSIKDTSDGHRWLDKVK